MIKAKIKNTGQRILVRPYPHEFYDFVRCNEDGIIQGTLLRRDELEIIGDNQEITLPNGYQFKDENDNVINAQKIIQETKFNFNSVPQIWDDYKVLFVFSDDGRVSCRLSFYDCTPQDAIVSDLYVHESIRKQGGATAILNWCFECAKDRGCNSVSLRSDNDDWVREWYKRIGFEVESSQVWLKKNI